jgi:hypothetical protein
MGSVSFVKVVCVGALAALAALGLWASAGAAEFVGPLSWQSPVLVDPAGGGASLPFGVQAISCPSASLCAAVDTSGNVATSTAPAGGGLWRVAHIDNNLICYSGSCNQAWLWDVSCPSVALCVAVDGAGNVLTSTDPAGGPPAWSATKIGDDLRAVSCASVSLCVAVDFSGDLFASSSPTAGAAAWNMAQVHSGACPPATGACYGDHLYLDAIACPSNSLCVAGANDGYVLSSTDPTGGAGAWRATYVDNNHAYCGSGSGCQTAIASVSCPSVSLCAASDDAGDVVTTQDPAGAKWALSHAMPAPRPRAYGLAQLSCPSTSRCVGIASDGRAYATDRLLSGAVWDGTPIDNACALTLGSTPACPTDVACPSALLCVAVDMSGHAIVGHALSEAELRTLLGKTLQPRGRRARTTAILRRKSLSLSLTSPAPGTIRVKWFSRSSRQRRSVLVARGAGQFPTAGRGTIRLVLTRAGISLLRSRISLRLKAYGTLQLANGQSVSVSGPVNLTH